MSIYDSSSFDVKECCLADDSQVSELYKRAKTMLKSPVEMSLGMRKRGFELR